MGMGANFLIMYISIFIWIVRAGSYLHESVHWRIKRSKTVVIRWYIRSTVEGLGCILLGIFAITTGKNIENSHYNWQVVLYFCCECSLRFVIYLTDVLIHAILLLSAAHWPLLIISAALVIHQSCFLTIIFNLVVKFYSCVIFYSNNQLSPILKCISQKSLKESSPGTVNSSLNNFTNSS